MREIYYDVQNPGSFGGVEKLYKEAKKKLPLISRDFVKRWLEKRDTWSLFKNVNRKFPRLQIIVDSIDEQWQADLLDMSWFSKQNSGVRYILTIIDVMSRFAWAIPLKDKKSQSIYNAFKSVFQTRKPQKIQTDQGKEFVNKELQDFFKKEGVKFFTSTDDVIKCAIVERFNKTLRSKIYRFIHSNQSYEYLPKLQDIMKSYNESFHSTIKMAPIEVNKDNIPTVMRNIKSKNEKIEKQRDKFKVGDYVRITRSKGIFEKGALSNFGEEVYRIWKKKLTQTTPIYRLEDLI